MEKSWQGPGVGTWRGEDGEGNGKTREGGKGNGEKKGKEEEAFYRWIFKAHGMPGWNELVFSNEFQTPGTPARY